MAVARKITQWSYSRWKTYQECPRKAKYSYIDRMKTPESPAMARGTAIHKAAEDYITGARKTIAPELKNVKATLQLLRKGGASAEGELAFTINWQPVGWFDPSVWVRVKVDATMPTSGKVRELLVVDWKSGKKYPDHENQLSLYGLAGLIINPLVDAARCQDHYTDMPKDNVLEHVYKRVELPALQKDWAKQTKAMLNDTKFAPLPSYSCPRCPFSKANGGPCEF